MNSHDILKYKNYIVAAFLVVFSLFALWIRLFPAEGLVTETGVNLIGNDPWYILRQVENTIANFPGYAWFDPMTQYPTGNVIHWGSLFAVITGAFCILMGASTRPEIMYWASWVPALMGMLMVPVVYCIGKKIADWKTGILAAILISVASGLYFSRSLFGFVDHHIAEALFGAVFCLAYIGVIAYTRTHPVDLKQFETLKKPLILSVIAGVAYLLGLFIMPTMILFALIVALYTLVQFVINAFTGDSGKDLLLINIVVFLSAIVGLLIYGFNSEGIGLARYSMGHVIAYLAIIIGTFVLYGVSRLNALKGKPVYYYLLALAGIGVIGALILMVVSPEMYNLLVGNFYSFFGQSARTGTIEEAAGWSYEHAWISYNYCLLLMTGGLGVLLYSIWREKRPEHLFVVIWSLVILISTIRHLRYEYYFAANVALLSAVCIGAGLEFGWADVRGLVSRKSISPVSSEEKAEPAKVKKSKKKAKGSKPVKPAEKRTAKPWKALVFAGVAILGLISFGVSLDHDLETSNSMKYAGMYYDWMESLEWMGEHTPDTGVDYYEIYDKETFKYPSESYGVMSWWDYGHYITFISKRIPNANPFQHGVAGPDGAAAFFIQQSENDSSAILDRIGTRYVVTDYQMDMGKFGPMAIWYNSTLQVAPYITYVQTKDGETAGLLSDAYFQTMISKLHNFDGSMTMPNKDYLVNYGGKTLSQLVLMPVEKVPALRHYRLVHESPTNIFNSPLVDMKFVKIFEYVPGAHIKGEGIIEVPVVTNEGREFVYRQESHDGEFIVPFSTSGSSYEVKTVGKYKIAGTGEEFEVPEEAVMGGLYIN